MAYDCVKGVVKYRKLLEGYSSIPVVRLRSQIYDKHLIAELMDRKDFQLIVLDKTSGDIVKKVEEKGDGPIGEGGRVSMTIQDGHPVLFSKVHFKY